MQPDIGTAHDWSEYGLAGLVIFALFTFGGVIVASVCFYLNRLEKNREKNDNIRQSFLETCLCDHRTERAELVETIKTIGDDFREELKSEREHRERIHNAFQCKAQCPLPRSAIWLLLACLLPTSLLATEFPLTVREVLDGDTIVADVEVGLDGLVFHSQTIRFADIDCWETTRRRAAVKVTTAEIEKGKLAKADLEALLSSAKVITAAPADKPRDVYGRRLMSLQADGKSIAEYLRSRGHERQ